MTAITNVPDEIFLVFEYAEEGNDFADFSDVTWCADQMSDSDVKFVRADRIATQAAEIEWLRESLKKQQALTGSFIESSAIIAKENQRLRAHIQEAADDAASNTGRAAENEDQYLRGYFEKLHDFHLSALAAQPKEPTK